VSQLQFSRRTLWEIKQNPLTQLRQILSGQGITICDWTVSNPTLCGFPYDREGIASSLTIPATFTYAPEPAGALTARKAVADLLASQGVYVDPVRLLLTASSSEAYSFLFRLLCNPDESIAVPKPGYPLCDDLAQLNDITLNPYRMHYAGSWHLDEKSLRQAVTASTRAIVVIHPNNPTGNYLSPDEQAIVAQIARENEIAIIADEVFLTFPFTPETAVVSCAKMEAPLVFTLNGLSKLAGLPQMKLGWIGVHGNGALSALAMQKLEMIADTYLSVNTPVQMALPEILQSATGLGEYIRKRVARNYGILKESLFGSAISVLHTEAGWNTVLQLPRIRSDEEWALHLLKKKKLLVYPGHFFDMDTEACLVISLLPEESQFQEYCSVLRTTVTEDISRG
jgi:alanine-synthesizing transaminase